LRIVSSRCDVRVVALRKNESFHIQLMFPVRGSRLRAGTLEQTVIFKFPSFVSHALRTVSARAGARLCMEATAQHRLAVCVYIYRLAGFFRIV